MVYAKYPPVIVLFVIVKCSSPPVNMEYEVGDAEQVIGMFVEDVDNGASIVQPVMVI
jgi:hypothetical protein